MKLTEENLKELIREELSGGDFAGGGEADAAGGGLGGNGGDGGGDQEEKMSSDVDRVLKYIDKINTPNEYAQLVTKILNHNVRGKARALKVAGGKNGARLAAMFPEA